MLRQAPRCANVTLMRTSRPYRNAVEAQQLIMADLRKPELKPSERAQLSRALAELEISKERMLERGSTKHAHTEPPALWTEPERKSL
jgi:arginine repressor